MATRSKILCDGTLSEDAIQCAVMDWVRMNPAIEPYIFHIPNGGIRRKSQAVLFKKLGVKSGVADLFIALPRNGFHGFWLELKSEKGKLSAAQQCFLKDMEEQHYFCAVVYTIEEAIEKISAYCFK